MEFEFIKNTLLGEYAVRCNMEHQIVGRWLQEEIGQDLAKLKHVLTLIDKAEQSPAQEFLWTGREISLLVQGDEITVQENALAYESEHELETDFALYDSESIAACGREDFVALLTQWQSFIQIRVGSNPSCSYVVRYCWEKAAPNRCSLLFFTQQMPIYP